MSEHNATVRPGTAAALAIAQLSNFEVKAPDKAREAPAVQLPARDSKGLENQQNADLVILPNESEEHKELGVRDYLRHGFVLVPIPAGTKGPTTTGWNLRQNCIADPADAARITGNVGLAHAYSGTCAIDIDDLDASRRWLDRHGLSLDALLTEPDAVMISSGRPNRAKLLYRLPAGLAPPASKKIIEDKANIIDFRCGTSTGKTAQDVLPPSVHPDTGKPYAWVYGDDLVGDWRDLPPIPPKLLDLWLSLLEAAPATEVKPPSAGLDELRTMLGKHDPSCDRDTWVRTLAAIHHETRGSPEGLALANEWSSQSPKYIGFEDVETSWRSFHTDHASPVTIASLRVDKPASIEEFEVLEPQAGNAVIDDLPAAQHRCSNQANANRIREKFKDALIASAGRFFHWTGTHWQSDEGQALRYALRLSQIIGHEIDAERKTLERLELGFTLDHGADKLGEIERSKRTDPRRCEPDYVEVLEQRAFIDALIKWSKHSEMAHAVNAALTLLRKTLAIEHDQLDRDPWMLNCRNGTIDLRTGALRPHERSDYITRCIDIDFDPAAQAPRWEQFMLDIMDGDAAKVAFLQRWAGYAATGSVREQCMVVRVGTGSNGKTSEGSALDDVLGAYACVAAPGLLVGSGDRHPTEVADLRGRRLVTASESDDGAVLREGFVKAATGGERLKGRFMRGDFFEFTPTHKLQLLSNHKPQIRGSDFGIWRRLLLVNYAVRFGTPEQVAAGQADRIRDESVAEGLRAERAGILRWIVAGAAQWFAGGLQPPDSVLQAGREYQTEQDRVAQFAAEDLEAGEGYKASSGSVYLTYQAWCKASGYQALGKNRLIDEVLRVLPGCARTDWKEIDDASRKRRLVRGVKGVRLTGGEL